MSKYGTPSWKIRMAVAHAIEWVASAVHPNSCRSRCDESHTYGRGCQLRTRR